MTPGECSLNTRSIRLARKMAESFRDHALLYLELGRPDEARKWAEEATKLEEAARKWEEEDK